MGTTARERQEGPVKMEKHSKGHAVLIFKKLEMSQSRITNCLWEQTHPITGSTLISTEIIKKNPSTESHKSEPPGACGGEAIMDFVLGWVPRISFARHFEL